MVEAEAYRALSSKSRLDIIKQLHRKPMSVEEIAGMLNLQPITIRHHLQSLVEAGLIEATEERAGSVGRPKIFYKIVKEPPEIGYPKRKYLMLSSFIVNTMRHMLGEEQAKKVLRRAGFEMGENTIKRLESEHQIKEWTIRTYQDFVVKNYLEKMGAEPQVIEVDDKRIVYRLHNCLFFEMAVKMPEIMCDTLHESFHEGLAKSMGKNFHMSRMTCMSKGDPYCEHSCEWLK